MKAILNLTGTILLLLLPVAMGVMMLREIRPAPTAPKRQAVEQTESAQSYNAIQYGERVYLVKW